MLDAMLLYIVFFAVVAIASFTLGFLIGKYTKLAEEE